ncbi:uncharacterized protein [Musca autumnalis]|uniref:uncharacterized protein n=1 Tax=Musca autumnalis TaxID=221902 RepID=UPI003CF0B679
MPSRMPMERRSVATRSIVRGTLGDASDDESVSSPGRFSSHIINPYQVPPSTSQQAKDRGDLTLRDTQNQPTNRTQSVLRGAAKRKQKSYRQRNLADLRKMIKLQKDTKLQIPRAPFARLVREITTEVSRDVTHYTSTALEAIQEATEMFLTQVLQDAYMLTLHRRCVTLSISDMVLIRSLKFNL